MCAQQTYRRRFPSSTSRRWLSFVELDPEFTAFTQLRLESDLPAHALDRFAHDGQANAGSFVFVRWMDPREHSENPFVVFRANADAVVLKPESSLGVDRLGQNANAWNNSRGNKLDCVAQQVGD